MSSAGAFRDLARSLAPDDLGLQARLMQFIESLLYKSETNTYLQNLGYEPETPHSLEEPEDPPGEPGSDDDVSVGVGCMYKLASTYTIPGAGAAYDESFTFTTNTKLFDSDDIFGANDYDPDYDFTITIPFDEKYYGIYLLNVEYEFTLSDNGTTIYDLTEVINDGDTLEYTTSAFSALGFGDYHPLYRMSSPIADVKLPWGTINDGSHVYAYCSGSFSSMFYINDLCSDIEARMASLSRYHYCLEAVTYILEKFVLSLIKVSELPSEDVVIL